MKEILLKDGLVSVVDDEDYSRLAGYEWYTTETRGRRYAIRVIWREGHSVAICMSREIMGLTDADKTVSVVHIDDNSLNNTKSNLLVCDRSEAVRSQSVKSEARTSRFKGVSWDKRRRQWRAQITVNRRSRMLGRFANEEAAAHAYDEAASLHFGAVWRGNFACGDAFAAREEIAQVSHAPI